MTLSGWRSGFNYLRRRGPPTLGGQTRPIVVGALLGALMAWSWLAHETRAAQQQHDREQALRAQVSKAEADVQKLAALERAAQARREQFQREQALQVQHRYLLSTLEALARSSGARLTQLGFDGRFLSVHGHLPAADLQPWAARTMGSPSELMEVAAVPSDKPEAPASGQIRFTMRWPVPSEAASP